MSLGHWNRVGVVLAPEDAYASYYVEALEYAGIPYQVVERLEHATFHEFDTLLFCGYGKIPSTLKPDLNRWLAAGNSAVFSGSAWGSEHALGLKPAEHHTSIGWVQNDIPSRYWPENCETAKFFGGTSHFSSDSEVLATTLNGEAALTLKRSGKGTAWFFGPHVGQTISFIQFGRSVETDGISAVDGTARLDDGIHRAEDGITLNFETDRITDPRSPTPFFAHAHADRIREIWIRTVIAAMETTGTPFVLTWPWPNGADSVAMLTIDCPQADPDTFRTVSRIISNIGGRPAWLIGHPGLPSDMYRNIRGALQEVGLLLTINTDSDWDPEKAKIQHVSLTRSSSFRHVDAIRAENGRWEGYMQPYDMATRSGARLFVSKGGRQPGATGFTFGSCIPTAPWKRDGTRYDLFELPYLAFVPGFPDAAAEAILTEVQARNGCFHMAAELRGICEPGAQSALHRLILIARQSGLKFVLPSQVAHHQKQRRQLRIAPFLSGEVSGFNATTTKDVEGMNFLIGGVAELEPAVNGNPIRGRVVQRFGTNLWTLTLDFESKRTVGVEIRGELLKNAA